MQINQESELWNDVMEMMDEFHAQRALSKRAIADIIRRAVIEFETQR